MGGCVCVCSEELGYPKLSSTDINMTFSCTLLPLTALTLLCLLLQGSLATDGLDISIYQGAVSGSTWSCLHSSGFDFAIVQVYDGGSANKDCVGNVEAATSAGFAHVDIYAFLCPTCMSGSGSQQVGLGGSSTNLTRVPGIYCGQLHQLRRSKRKVWHDLVLRPVACLSLYLALTTSSSSY